MAFVLTPRFAPAYQASPCNPFGFGAPAPSPAYAYRIARPRPQRPQYASFNHFFNQVDELLSEIDHENQRQAQLEAQREALREAHIKAHRQRKLRKLVLRAQFSVNQTEQGWQVEGETQGFDQENFNIEIADEYTLKVTGNTQWQAEKKPEAELQVEAAPAIEPKPAEETTQEGVTINEPDYETFAEADARASTPDSDTRSNKSYQATVEDDFEDLGAETSSLISSSSSTPAETKEPKGKEPAVEPQSTPAQPEVPAQQEERVHGSFQRTFRFPERIDAANVSATFKDGVLRVTVPKAPVQQVRRIAIL
jgi:HSP20 family molecular chaperone IbpA